MLYKEEFDVIVCGGGIAGVAAALEAARAGMRTALIEKTIIIGGLATSGIINVYLPLCDGYGNQVTWGISEELLKLSMLYGPGEISDWQSGNGSRYAVVFSPAAFALALDEVLIDAGVEIWLDTLITNTLVQDGHVRGITVENKSGRGNLLASCIIDATGDADVAFKAGAACEVVDNYLSVWTISSSMNAARRATDMNDGAALLETFQIGGDNVGRGVPPELPKYDGTDARQVTQFVLEGRRLVREHFQTRQSEDGCSRSDIYPVTLPSVPQFRTTRRIVGKSTLVANQHATRFSDSIGLAADWRKSGYVWEIPYGTLVPRETKGLLAAGRCISSEGDAWEVTRVIPVAALTGQAAGVAAVIAVESQTTPDAIPVERIQRVLSDKGIKLNHTVTSPA